MNENQNPSVDCVHNASTKKQNSNASNAYGSSDRGRLTIEVEWKKRRPFYYTLQAKKYILGSVLSIDTKEWLSSLSMIDHQSEPHKTKEEAMKAIEDYYSLSPLPSEDKTQKDIDS